MSRSTKPKIIGLKQKLDLDLSNNSPSASASQSADGDLRTNEIYKVEVGLHERSEGLSFVDYSKEHSDSSCDTNNMDSSFTSNESLVSVPLTENMTSISDTPLAPVVSEKINVLVAVLKNIQSNMQEMKKIISVPKTSGQLRNDEYISSVGGKKSVFSNIIKELKPLNIDIHSSKTDESKVNKILSLLHNITDALSSYEQIPLLAENHEQEFEYKGPSNPTIMNTPIEVRDLDNQEETELPKEAIVSNVDIDNKSTLERNSHQFSKKTKSLRQEIDQAIKRKDALDEKFKLFISQQHYIQDDDADNPPKTQYFREDISSLNAIDEHLFPSIPDSEKSEGIEDLKRDEEVVLGLAESGLSEEINSLNNTIKGILKENQQYQAFFKDLSNDATTTTSTKKPEENMEKFPPVTSPINFDESKVITSSPGPEISFSRDNGISKECKPSTYAAIEATFEAKIQCLVEAQERAMAAFLREKQTSNERCRELERMISELKADEENKRFLWEELVGVENCHHQGEFLNSNRSQNDGVQTSNRSYNTDPHAIETHSICQAHIEKLSQEKKDLLATLAKSDSHNSSPKRKRPNLSSSSLQITSNDVNCPSESSEKFVSLPTLKLTSCDDIHHGAETSNAGTVSLDEELHVLKSRVKFLESYLKKQYCDNSSGDQNNSPPCTEVPVVTTNRSGNTLSENYFKCGVRSRGSSQFPEGTSEKSAGCLHEDIDSSQLYQKIIILLEEKEIMSNRLDELMAVTRELAYHYRNTKLELSRVLGSQSDKRKNKRGFFNSGDAVGTSSEENSVSDNGTGEQSSNSKDFSAEQQKLEENFDNSKQLINNLKMQHKANEKFLQDRITRLQVESQKAWTEVQNKSLELEKLKVDKEKLNYFLTSSLTNTEEENLRLQSTVMALREENRILCNEMKTFKSCFEVPVMKVEGIGPFSEDQVDKSSTVKKTVDKETQINEQGDCGNKIEGDEKGNCSVVSSVLPESDVNAKWQQSLSFLQKCLVEEKLQSQLLAAADMENSARVSVLRQAAREKGDMYQVLLGKYQKLRHSFVSKKAEKRHQQDLLHECSKKMEELNSTTTAIEGNYKVMLSTMGHNIGIAVEILSSHLYFTPTQIHPSPELSADPAFWFAAQCSRLRWLQSQLRKLCLYTWKSGLGTIPDKRKYSNKIKKTLSSEMKSQSLDFPLNESSKNEDKLLHSLSPNLSMFSTLNDAEISLTSQQVKLAQTKTHQFNHLVNLLKEHAFCPSSEETTAAPLVPNIDTSMNNNAIDDISCSTETESGFSNVTKDFSLYENEECPSPVVENQRSPASLDKAQTYSLVPTKLSRTGNSGLVASSILVCHETGSQFSLAEVSQENEPMKLTKEMQFPKGDQDYEILPEVTDLFATSTNKSLHSDIILVNEKSLLDHSNANIKQTFERDRDLGYVHHKNHFITTEKIPVVVHREDQ